LRPQDGEARQVAAASRKQADETAEAAQAARQSEQEKEFHPSEAMKRLFREAAKAMHPDLAEDEDDRARRHKYMADANRAYEEGDAERLRAVLEEWQASPDAVKGAGVGADLVRTIRKIARVSERLRAIEGEVWAMRERDLFNLRTKVEDAEKSGRDLLQEMAARVDHDVAEAHRRLAALARKAG
jgi:hypothetical protein